MIATDILYKPKITNEDLESQIEAWRSSNEAWHSRNEAHASFRKTDSHWSKSEPLMTFQDVNRIRRPFYKL